MTLTAETQALIADTELEASVTKELPPAYLTLTVARALDSSGAIIPRRFICSTILHSREINAVAGKKHTAYNLILRQVRMLGFEPMWTSVQDLTVTTEFPDDEPEEEPASVEPVYVPETPVEEPEQAGEHEDPNFGLVVQMPALDKSGWLTPLSDPLAYKRVYLEAWKIVTGYSVYNFSDLTADWFNIRASIAAVMMSGDAGEAAGVPAKAVNPWALGTNGVQEMCWIRVLRGTPDPTTKPFRAGNGVSRETYLMTLSGTPAFPEKFESARAWREKRAARNYVGTKGKHNVAAKDAWTGKRAQAHASGTAAKTAALKAGYDGEIAEIHYKWLYCATMRVLGEIHTEYERQLFDAGVTQEQIIEMAEKAEVAA